jgi:peptidoglycan/xylan/chitin deacetylase (PgdA/CDA1 family)
LTGLEILEAGSAAGLAAGLAFGGYMYAARWPGSRIFGPALTAPRNPAGASPEIALTFDDGPHPRWTPMLLEILEKQGVKATFFVLGQYAMTQKPLVRRMHEAGHLIANHSWTHPHLGFAGTQRTRDELARTKAELEATIGTAVKYFRPPYGERGPATLRIARELEMTPVLWNAMTADWEATAAEPVAQELGRRVERNRRRGNATNIVLHDGGSTGLDVNREPSVLAAGLLAERFGAAHQFVRVDGWQQRS